VGEWVGGGGAGRGDAVGRRGRRRGPCERADRLRRGRRRGRRPGIARGPRGIAAPPGAGWPPPRRRGHLTQADLTLRDPRSSLEEMTPRHRYTLLHNTSAMRAELERRGIDHLPPTDTEASHLACVLRGWHVMPRAASNTRAINARVWLAAALGAGGRYLAPDTPGHPADLEDDGPLVDTVVLMAVVQRHFLTEPQAGWDDAALGDALGLDGADVTRAQALLDAMNAIVPPAPAPPGAAAAAQGAAARQGGRRVIEDRPRDRFVVRGREEVPGPVEDEQPRAGDLRRERPPVVDREQRIVGAVDHERRRREVAEPLAPRFA